MLDEPRPGEVFEIEPSHSEGLLARLPWWLIAMLAFFVAELADPSVGLAVLCLKMGWEDFRTALWLRQRDPDCRRGAICSWFYLSSGLWRVCAWSLALILVAVVCFAAIAGKHDPADGQPNADIELPAQVMMCMIVWLSSFAIATMLTVTIVVFALRRRTKVWISGSVSDSRRNNQWPPRPVLRKIPETNLLKGCLVGAGLGLIGIFLVVGAIAFLVAAEDDPAQNGNKQGVVALISVLIGAGILLGSAVVILVMGDRIFGRIAASSPTECWPDDGSIADSNPSG